MRLQRNLVAPGYVGQRLVPHAGGKRGVGNHGHDFKLMQVYFKPYPTCRWNHAALDGVQEILKARGWAANDVAAVDIGVASPILDKRLDERVCFNMVDAQFSMPYAVALVLHGEVPGPQWYDAPILEAPHIHETMRKVTIRPDPDMERLYRENQTIGAIVTVTDHLGTVERVRVEHAQGSAARPMSNAELELKYRRLAATVLDEPTAGEALGRIWNLERVERVIDITRLVIGAKNGTDAGV